MGGVREGRFNIMQTLVSGGGREFRMGQLVKHLDRKDSGICEIVGGSEFAGWAHVRREDGEIEHWNLDNAIAAPPQPERIKQYRNCALWATYTAQENGNTITYFTITRSDAIETQLIGYQWIPALFASGGTLEECRARVAKLGHAEIMRQMLSV
jgi:hypothetical protein